MLDEVDCPESEVALIRRPALIGIRDWEIRLAVVGDCIGESCSCGGDMMVIVLPWELESGATVNELETISLLDLRCIPSGRAGTGLSRSMPSREGVTPIYQAVGDEGDTLLFKSLESSLNIGFGWCMLPSEPLLRRTSGMPYPGSIMPLFAASISPKSGFRAGPLVVGLRSTIDWEAKALFVSVEDVERDVLEFFVEELWPVLPPVCFLLALIGDDSSNPMLSLDFDFAEEPSFECDASPGILVLCGLDPLGFPGVWLAELDRELGLLGTGGTSSGV